MRNEVKKTDEGGISKKKKASGGRKAMSWRIAAPGWSAIQVPQDGG